MDGWINRLINEFVIDLQLLASFPSIFFTLLAHTDCPSPVRRLTHMKKAAITAQRAMTQSKEKVQEDGTMIT